MTRSLSMISSALLAVMLFFNTSSLIAAEPVSASEPSEPVAQIAAESQTGTLILSRGDCLAVRAYTQSNYTHVAAVVVREGEPLVFDSMNGVGVRCLTLTEYLETQRPSEVHLFHPRTAFSKTEAEAFETHLLSQLGRPYGVTHHFSGKRAEGIHCSEYVTDALIAGHIAHAEQPARVSPGSLVAGMLEADVYTAGNILTLRPEPATMTGDEGWCRGMWSATKRCTFGCYSQCRRWFCCR